MRRHRSGYFWGFIFIIAGLLLVLQNLGYNIDFWKYFWPILLILIGLSIFLRPSRNNSNGDVIFDEGDSEADVSKRDYSAVFGHGEFDFTKMKPSDLRYEVSAVFGKAVVKIKKDAPIRIKGSSAFGDVIFPDGKSSAFSERVYEKNIGDKKEVLNLKVSAVFGAVEIVEG